MAQVVAREAALSEPIPGLMQDYPLTLHHIFWRLERLFGNKQVVTKRETGIHRYTYADLVKRVYRLANALTEMGIKPGDRVGTLAWNNYRHLELYYAVPLLGAVLHTLNMRLFPDQLEFVIRDGADRFIFVDASLLPVLQKLHGKLPSVERIVVLADDGEAIPPHQFADVLDYEQLLARSSPNSSTGRRWTSDRPRPCATRAGRRAIPKAWSIPIARRCCTR